MFANERRNKILELIKNNGSVTTTQLMNAFAVSIETVRRDLLVMEEEGLLERVHGGAVSSGKMQPYHPLPERMEENSDGKIELCRTAAALVDEADVISMDSGSTPVFFAKALKERLDTLTVITNSLDVLNELKGYKNFKVISTGGDFCEEENCFLGVIATDSLCRLRVNKTFIFPVAVSLKGGICNHTSDFVALQREMVRSADSVFVLADSSKFEKSDVFKQSDMIKEYIYITDKGLSPQLRNMYEENSINIICEKD